MTQLDDRLPAPAVRARVGVGAVHVAEARADHDAGGVMVRERASRQRGEARQFGQREVHPEGAGAAAEVLHAAQEFGVERAVRHHRGVEQLEIGVDRDRAGADDAAVVEHHAARAAALDQELAHGRAGLDLDAVARRGLGHRLADRAHAADGVAPDPALAVHLAKRMVQQHIAGSGRVRAAVEADHRVEAEQRLHQVVLEPAGRGARPRSG